MDSPLAWPPSTLSRLASGVLFAPLLCILGSAFIQERAWGQEKITYQDQVLPLVEANCSKCHNSDKKKADLDLTSY